MWDINELKRHREIIGAIDWDMTPEKAVETYLEWGTGWSRKGDSLRQPGQESLYFVIYDWEQPPQVTLVQRDVSGAREIAKIQVPEELLRRAVEQGGRKPGVGVYAITDEIKEWLQIQLV